MKVGTKVKIIKGFARGIVDFEIGDILVVGNYIHKDGVYLKAEGIIDLIKIKFEDMDKYIKEVKEQIVFNETFIEKIKAGKKIFTVRNKPISLGIYYVADDLKIEVIRSQKVGAYFHQYIGQECISFNIVGDDRRNGMSINTKFGFDTQKEMVDFYKGYLKDSTAYLMQFRIVS